MITKTQACRATAALAAVVAAAALTLGAAGPARADAGIGGPGGYQIVGGTPPKTQAQPGLASHSVRAPLSKASTVRVGQPVNVKASGKGKTVKVTWRKPAITGVVTGYEIKVGSKTYKVRASSRAKLVKVARTGTYTVKVRAIAKSANGKNRASGHWVTRTVRVEAAAKTRTISQQNALETAARYLEYSAFSRAGLIRQLEYEKYPTADATWAVDRVAVNWREQAAKKATSYLEYSAFSRVGLIKQLEYEKHSSADATWAVDRLTVNWNEQAAKDAKSYLKYSSFSRGGLFDQLIYEGYTPAQADYGVSQTGL